MTPGTTSIEDRAAWVTTCIEEFAASEANRLNESTQEPAWGKPLIGFSRGDDPLYEKIKNDVGPFYWTPWDAFGRAFPSSDASDEDLTVISWVLPHTDRTKADSRKGTSYPSERWARARKYGEEFNIRLRDHVVDGLMASGCEAVAPTNHPSWERKVSERYGFASVWSERHAAYVAGLGTFGLCDGLITPAGKAMRCGSVIARIQIPPTERPYTDHHAYCLHFSRGTCGKCIERCPVGAITREGHDKKKCLAYEDDFTTPYVLSHFGIAAYGCGLCQTGVPCESRIPVRREHRR
ncbi:MAG: 4Fe-4S double cluster binding domain-containing protein [Syntrophorhabdales bacterium]|jgi:epoxyqueuosine reductase QueG